MNCGNSAKNSKNTFGLSPLIPAPFAACRSRDRAGSSARARGPAGLRALERSGAISGYHAHLDANALGLTFEALVFVTMRGGDRATVDAFEQTVAAIPHVREAQRLFGEPDYVLRVITADLPAFQEVYDNSLATLPGVQRLSSTLVMKSVVENRPLPL